MAVAKTTTCVLDGGAVLFPLVFVGFAAPPPSFSFSFFFLSYSCSRKRQRVCVCVCVCVCLCASENGFL